ncbi:hypothetical protein HGRIS_000091 [Hohenbuehelia grisea]|uniref:Uncharacterized protein n=1 Tax=Hohenbuehelia grisea TaxID=104357 RepID=A0ABR3JRV9_9AGAR
MLATPLACVLPPRTRPVLWTKIGKFVVLESLNAVVEGELALLAEPMQYTGSTHPQPPPVQSSPLRSAAHFQPPVRRVAVPKSTPAYASQGSTMNAPATSQGVFQDFSRAKFTTGNGGNATGQLPGGDGGSIACSNRDQVKQTFVQTELKTGNGGQGYLAHGGHIGHANSKATKQKYDGAVLKTGDGGRSSNNQSGGAAGNIGSGN